MTDGRGFPNEPANLSKRTRSWSGTISTGRKSLDSNSAIVARKETCSLPDMSSVQSVEHSSTLSQSDSRTTASTTLCLSGAPPRPPA